METIRGVVIGCCRSRCLSIYRASYYFPYMNTSSAALINMIPLIWDYLPVCDRLDLSVFIYFFSLLFDPLYSSSAFHYEQFRNYVGLLSVVLIIIAVGCAVSRRKDIDRRLNSLTYFLSISALLIILKKFGFVAVNWIGALPYYRLSEFRKYEEPILSFCIWVLCAIGIERLRRCESTRRLQAIALGGGCLVLVSAFVSSRSTIGKEGSHSQLLPNISKFAISLPGILLVLLLAAMIVDWVLRRAGYLPPVNRKSWLGIFAAVLICIELSLNYIVPIYRRVYDRLPSVRRTVCPQSCSIQCTYWVTASGLRSR